MLYSSGCIGVRKPYLASSRTEEAEAEAAFLAETRGRTAGALDINTNRVFASGAKRFALLGPTRHLAVRLRLAPSASRAGGTSAGRSMELCFVPTISQLVRSGRTTIVSKTKSPALQNSPQKRGV